MVVPVDLDPGADRREERLLRSSPRLPLVFSKALLTAPGRHGTTLPAAELGLSEVHVDRGHLAAYDRVCGFRLGDDLPPTYPHVLAFPLQVALMADRSFPFSLPGLLHVRNAITQYRPIGVGEHLDLHVHAERLRPHRAGRQFDLVSRVEVDGEEVWEGRATYLSRGGGDEAAPAEGPEVDVPATATARWQVPGDVGRRYAAVAGDLNPIHLHPVAARAFGFPRAIAHGMWAKARALAALEGRLPDRLTAAVAFRRPLVVPATVEVATRRIDRGWDLAIRREEGGAYLAMAVREGPSP
ncbi:MAG TPA: MaoC/PaaZ C-terminal domain-containing protein [Acidimicrobiales bacterium]|nr:MaoC/PaaZ C-terminal domain-containing protein [Acidimicrobiales bacterium]